MLRPARPLAAPYRIVRRASADDPHAPPRKAARRHASGDADRTTEKAIGVLRLCSAWSAPEGVAAPLLIASMHRAFWVIAPFLEGPSGEATKPAFDALAFTTFLPTLLTLSQRVHGAQSLEAAECVYSLAHCASAFEDHFATIRWGREAAQLLLKLRGEQFYVPPAESKALCDSITWETADGRASTCEGSHIDCLGFLSVAHSKLPGQQKLAMSAATRHLTLLDARFGRGHPLTIPGAYSMMHATFHNGALDARCDVESAAASPLRLLLPPTR